MISVRSKSSYPIGNLLKGSKSKRPPGSAIPPAHGDASGRFGLVVLAHEECCSQGWLFVFSRLVSWHSDHTLPGAPSPRAGQSHTSGTLLSGRERVVCRFCFMVVHCACKATFLQRNICRDAGGNRKLF